MDEDFGLAYMTLVTDLELSGNEAEAFDVWKKLMVRWGTDEKTVQDIKAGFQAEGWLGVRRVYDKRPEDSSKVYFHGAAGYAQMGMKDKAFEYLERSLAGREIWIAFLKVDPRLDAIRDDPRFTDLAARVGLK